MNYKHIYHAGNYADILKHSILIYLISLLQQDHRKIFILDTHAGRGRYNLLSPGAVRSGEAFEGIQRLIKIPQEQFPKLIQSYLAFVQRFNPQKGQIHIYPGSPQIIESLLRPQDRAAFCELNEKEFFKLHGLFHEKKNIKMILGDGYEALLSFLPPKEKQGLVLIDPPFEKKEEIQSLETTIVQSMKIWPEGVFLLWYPIKNDMDFQRHYDFMQKHSPHKICLLTLNIPHTAGQKKGKMRQTAVMIFNPPEAIFQQQEAIQNLEVILQKLFLCADVL